MPFDKFNSCFQCLQTKDKSVKSIPAQVDNLFKYWHASYFKSKTDR